MPELPEVETIKRSLEKSLLGKRIVGVQILLAKQFKGEKKQVLGKRVTAIKRRGKILIISLSGGKNLVIHFKLTGQLVWVPGKGRRVTLGHPIPFAGSELPAKTTHIIFDIDGGQLFFNDLRQFGWVKVIDENDLEKETDKLGVEPLTENFSHEYLKQAFSKTKKPIKLVLMDQEKIAGIGNIYANEALFEAGILPTRPAKELTEIQLKKLKDAVFKVLKEGLKYGGSSAADEAYIKPTGEAGEYQKHFRVYQRENQQCNKCGGKIKRINLGGRGTFFCPTCQR